MRIKLKRAEMQSLERFVSTLLEQSEPTTLNEKLVIAVLQKLYVKIAKSLVVLQQHYSIKFDDITALAFAIEFSTWPLTPTDYTDNLVLRLTNQIQQHYA